MHPSPQNTAKLAEQVAAYDPTTDPHIDGDAFKTLFVARLAPETTERTLQREFEEYGPIKNIRLVTDASGRPKGYAFLEYEHRNDMKMAYKMADGRKVDSKRVLVDVERGRTVPDWYGGGGVYVGVGVGVWGCLWVCCVRKWCFRHAHQARIIFIFIMTNIIITLVQITIIIITMTNTQAAT